MAQAHVLRDNGRRGKGQGQGATTDRTGQRNVPSCQSVDDGKCPTVRAQQRKGNTNAANVSTIDHRMKLQ